MTPAELFIYSAVTIVVPAFVLNMYRQHHGFDSLSAMWDSPLNDEEFSAMMELIFTEENFEYTVTNRNGEHDSRYFESNGYTVSADRSGYYMLYINGIQGFSLRQKKRFFDRLQEFKKQRELKSVKEKLLHSKIAGVIAERKLLK